MSSSQEWNQQVIRIDTHIVQPLECQAARHGAVTNDSHHLAVMLQSFRANRKSKRCRNGIGGMPRDKRIVTTLGRIRKTTDTLTLAIGIEYSATTCQDFVSIGLMPHIPDNTVGRRVKHIMQGNGKLDNAQAGRQMPRVGRQLLNDKAAQLVTDLRQLVNRKFPQIGRVVYLAE